MSDVIVKIYDLGANELADISAIALEKTNPVIANGPRSFTVEAPAADVLLTTVAGDGYPNLQEGNRKLVVWEDADPMVDDPIFHGRIFGCERDGDADAALVTITAFDPWVELGFEADDRAGRIVRDGTHTLYGDPSFFTPNFSSSVLGQAEMSGPDLIQQVLTYSQGDPTTNPVQGEGPLPIDIISGTWDLLVPPALDLNPNETLDWPVLVGDFIQQLIDTNSVDFILRPVRPGTGLNLAGVPDDYIMVEASAKSKLGTDRTATVHFDYATGSFNAKAAREVTDFSTHCAHLWYELGPRLSTGHWQADFTPHGHVGADASATKYGGPGSPPGYDSFIRVLDTTGAESMSRPLYQALFDYEFALRVEPRKLLYITPAEGDKSLFLAPVDFDIFDVVQIKTGARFGKVIDEAQRVYGYTKTWTRENVVSMGQLLTSADVS